MLHLEPDEYALLPMLDGTRSREEIEAAGGASMTELLDDLWTEGYLEGSLPPKRKRLAITLHGVEFGGFDRIVRAVNRHGGQLVFSVPGTFLLAALSACGLGFFIDQVVAGRQLTVSSASPILAVVALRLLSLAAVGPHETGHALVMVHNRRRVGRFGVGFYWGALTFYVDASEALFLARRTRMLQASAGVLTDLVTCGSASLVALVGGNATWAVVLREFAVLGYLNILINSVPLLELDGYWFLADALDRPTLQRDARQALAATIRRLPAPRGLAIYGSASIVFGFGLMVLGFGAWWHLFGGLFHTLWRGGPGYKVVAGYLLLPFVPMIIHLGAQPLHYLARRSRQPAVSTV